mgnify:CR=1 FL=1
MAASEDIPLRVEALLDELAETDRDIAADLLRAHPEYRIGAADAIHLATALGLLRYHAVAADPAPAAFRP